LEGTGEISGTLEGDEEGTTATGGPGMKSNMID